MRFLPSMPFLPLNKYFRFILVDSTRAGKRIPDALSKTVPIWCAVINRALLKIYPELATDGWDTKLYTPPQVVSAQEHAQIETRLDGWATALAVCTRYVIAFVLICSMLYPYYLELVL